MRYSRLFISLLMMITACGTREYVQMDYPPETSVDSKCSYTWREDDSWALISWAVLDSEDAGDALALSSGYQPGTRPEPGATIQLPLSSDLEDALEVRMESARLVRSATEAFEDSDAITGHGADPARRG